MNVDNGGMDCNVAERLWATLCNRGASWSNPGIAGTFYASDPRMLGATPLCTATTQNVLTPGQCETVHCDRSNPPKEPQDLWFRANDDGKMANAVTECKLMNDLLFLPQYVCK